MAPQLEFRGKTAVLTLGSDENRVSPDWISAAEELLTTVEKEADSLVSVGEGKFFSNGLDLDWVLANGDRMDWYIEQVQRVFVRLLTLPVPTVAAVNGHAFGAGAMIALSHDFRIMRADRGFYCLPEVDVQLPFTKGMAALVQGKSTPQAAAATMITGRRLGGPQALDYGIVDAVADEDKVLDDAVALVQSVADKNPQTLGAIKQTMYRPIIDALLLGRA